MIPGLLLELALLAVPLALMPGQESFTPVKRGVLLAWPALWLLLSPGRSARALAAELRSPVGLGLALLALYVALRGGAAQAAGLLAGLAVLAHARAMPGPELERRAGRALALMVLVQALVAALQLWGGSPFPGLRFGLHEQPVGLAGNRNQLAYLLVLALPLVLASRRGRGPAFERAWATLAAVGAVAVLPFTLSRGAWLAAAGMALLRGVLPARVAEGRKVPWIVVPGITLALLLPLGIVLAEAPLAALSGGAKAGTVGTRVFAWRTAWPALREAGPWGHGPGSFPRLFPLWKQARLEGLPPEELGRLGARARVTRRAHLELLELALEWGWAGAGAALLLLGGALAGSLATLRTVHRPGTRARIRLGIVGILGVALAAGVHFPLQEPATALLALVYLALARGPHAMDGGATGAARGGPGLDEADGLPLPGLVAALVLAGVTAGHGARVLRTEWALSRGLRALARGHLSEALTRLEEAHAHTPSARAANALGRLLLRARRAEAAVERFREAERLEPSYTHALNLALGHRALGERDAARRALERAFARQPSARAAFFLGSALESAGAREEALRIYALGEALPDFDPRLGYSRGRLQWAMGREAEARVTLRRTADMAGAVRPEDAGELAAAARLRIESLRLLEHSLRTGGEAAAADAVRGELEAMVSGYDPEAFDPPGTPEGRW